MNSEMTNHVTFAIKCLMAGRTFVRLLTSVRSEMTNHVTLEIKCLMAGRAFVRLLASVNSSVYGQLVSTTERLMASRANVWFFSASLKVHSHSALCDQIVLATQRILACRDIVMLLTSVSSKMSSQVFFKAERLKASGAL